MNEAEREMGLWSVISLADSLGRTPNIVAHFKESDEDTIALLEEYGSWDAVLNRCNLEPEEHNTIAEIPEELIQQDVLRVARLLGRRPTSKEYGYHGEFRYKWFSAHGEGWKIETDKFLPSNSEIASTLLSQSEIDILTDIRWVLLELGTRPTQHEYDEHGEIPSSDVIRVFGSWDNALSRAVPDSALPFEEKAVREDIRRVWRMTEQPPTVEEFVTYGTYPLPYVIEEFGGRWYKALQASQDGSLPEVDSIKEFLVHDIRAIYNILGTTPQVDDYEVFGAISSSQLERNGGLRSLVECAGLDVYSNGSGRGYTIDEEDLLDDLRRVGEKLGKVPTGDEYKEHGRFSQTSVQMHFDTWMKGLEQAGFDVPPRYGRKISDDELIDDLQRVIDMVGEKPTYRKYDELGKFQARTLTRRFGSWDDVFEHVDY